MKFGCGCLHTLERKGGGVRVSGSAKRLKKKSTHVILRTENQTEWVCKEIEKYIFIYSRHTADRKSSGVGLQRDLKNPLTSYCGQKIKPSGSAKRFEKSTHVILRTENQAEWVCKEIFF